MNEILKKIGDTGIIPVIKIENPDDAIPLCKALMDGGLYLAEVTFRTLAAEEAIRRITRDLPDILIGAGTVLNVDQVQKAANAGAKFMVSPGFNADVVEYCVKKGILIIPGCSSPTEIEMALKFKLETVKFFPAEACGGLKTLKALSAPYGMVKFIPTGGINIINLNEYLSFNKVLACGGSWMVKEDLIKNGNYVEISALTREAINKILGFDIAHIGINSNDAEIVKKLENLFNLPVKEGKNSSFIGTGIEVNRYKGLGTNGHIAIKTNNISRAMAYLDRSGIAIDMNTADGSSGTVYLNDEIGGFAIQLLQNK